MAEQRTVGVVVPPLVLASDLPADGASAIDLPAELNGMTYQACRGDLAMRLDGSTYLQLQDREGGEVGRKGDSLGAAQWLQACNNAGIEVRVQVNESITL